MVQVKIKYNPDMGVWQVLGEDARVVWNALEIFEIFNPDDDTLNHVDVKSENVDKFIARMASYYNIDVVKAD